MYRTILHIFKGILPAWSCILAVYFTVPLGVCAQSFEYTENKGQWPREVDFQGRLSSGSLYLRNTGYRVLQFHPDDYRSITNEGSGHGFFTASGTPSSQIQVAAAPEKAPVIRGHAYDVIFKGSNANAAAVTERRMPGYSNYFLGNDPARWAAGVNSYGMVTYKNLYPGIDIRYYSENGFVKYDLLVAAGWFG